MIEIPLLVLRIAKWAAPVVVPAAKTAAPIIKGRIVSKFESGDWDMSIRDRKQDALTESTRKERRQAGELWWQKEARQERQAGRQARREAGEAFWQGWQDSEISGGAQQPAAPVYIPPGLGSRLPGPGDPGARGTVQKRNGNGNGWGGAGGALMSPLVLAAIAAGGVWLLTRKK